MQVAIAQWSPGHILVQVGQGKTQFRSTSFMISLGAMCQAGVQANFTAHAACEAHYPNTYLFIFVQKKVSQYCIRLGQSYNNV